MSVKGWIRSSIIEVFQKKTPEAKYLKDYIYLNGKDNLYPNSLVALLNDSPTAKRCSNLMAKYIIGQGLKIDFDINKRFTLNDLSTQIARQISVHYGAVIWIGYGIDESGKLVKNQFKVLDYSKFRKQIDDADGNNGKIIIKDWFSEKNIFGQDKNKSEKWFYSFNDNDAIVKSQIKKDFGKEYENETDFIEAVKNYRGQVYHLNLTPEYHYAVPLWDSVWDDIDSEIRIKRYTNSQTRMGFVGKTAILTSGLDEETEIAVKTQLKSFLGTEGSSDVWYLNVEGIEDISKCLKIEQIKPQYDDKLFAQTDQRIRKNITGAFNNIPEALIYSSESSLFGTNAETYKQMKGFYFEQNEYERKALENCLWDLGFQNAEFKGFDDPIITPIVE